MTRYRLYLKGRRRKKEEEHENHERWLVSYADFITLLFAFFTTLYAISTLDAQKMDKMRLSMEQSFDSGLFEPGSDDLSLDRGPSDNGDGISENIIITRNDMHWLKRKIESDLGSDAQKASIARHVLLGRIGAIDDIVKAVRFLIADAPYMTGAVLRLDGGYVLGGEEMGPMPEGIL